MKILYLLTAAYKYEDLEYTYNSIPPNIDIEWIITKARHREELILNFHHSRTSVLVIDSPDDKYGKRQEAFNYIKGREGMFHILDEGTIMHPNLYNLFIEAKDKSEALFIGHQDYYNNTRRLNACIPQEAKIDTGSCLCSNSLLEYAKWPENDDISPDYKFWKSIYNIPKKDKIIIDKPISYYNTLLNQIEG